MGTLTLPIGLTNPILTEIGQINEINNPGSPTQLNAISFDCGKLVGITQERQFEINTETAIATFIDSPVPTKGSSSVTGFSFNADTGLFYHFSGAHSTLASFIFESLDVANPGNANVPFTLVSETCDWPPQSVTGDSVVGFEYVGDGRFLATTTKKYLLSVTLTHSTHSDYAVVKVLRYPSDPASLPNTVSGIIPLSDEGVQCVPTTKCSKKTTK